MQSNKTHYQALYNERDRSSEGEKRSVRGETDEGQTA